MKVGFVGNGSDKFTKQGEEEARSILAEALEEQNATFMVSGHSPVGGIDIWAEEEAKYLNIQLDLKIPEVNQWNPVGRYGYKARNLDIARDSDVLYVILADQYPDEYNGKRFAANGTCYHCDRQFGSDSYTPHVKSGGCWTGIQALKLGKLVHWIVVNNY